MPHHRDTRIVRRSDGSLSIFITESGITADRALSIAIEIQEAAREAARREIDAVKRDRDVIEARLRGAEVAA